MSEQSEPFLGYFPEAELVFALVCPMGVEHTTVARTLQDYLTQFEYRCNPLRLSDFFPDLFVKLGQEWSPPVETAALADYKIDAGNRIRDLTKTNDILARVAASLIANLRVDEAQEPEEWKQPLPRTAHIISTLKRPEEVNTLRRIYGSGFFLIGLSASRDHRDRYFRQRGIDPAPAAALIEKDAAELNEYGQLTRETFHLADVFLSTENYHTEVPRFLDLVFGCPTITPRAEEQAMFMAYAASLRSGDLSRQVGAAIMDSHGDLLSVGWNEVPKSGGGLYGPEEGNDRDIARSYDSNEVEKKEMIEKILKQLGCPAMAPDEARRLLKPTGLLDITEFGRSVHAEMEALLACARTGRTVRGATLYTTTFPCHNCCRHIVAAGIARVVYVEPYAKSKAGTLHGDAISVNDVTAGKVPFVPFFGIGPRRYFRPLLAQAECRIPNRTERQRNVGGVEAPRCSASTADAAKHISGQREPCLGKRKGTTIVKGVGMSTRPQRELTHQPFWNRMEKNSQVVVRMQPWVKGSPVNQRTQTDDAKGADRNAVAPPPAGGDDNR